ncbi:DUF924-domain-containing protein [Tothia fuscella]|uniref:DUF924-domain-containing protein n=1 Tax=Tothia fuscella TaxID=1048955 RepID=A0A9P4TZC7_9PEZI|nr:DUF924-domain-containing protein [Tothia fuscella]
MSLRNFTLNKSIWNATLYNRVREVWFTDLPTTIVAPRKQDLDRWFTAGAEEKNAFDKHCHGEFNSALESISPSNYSSEKLSKDDIIKPFLSEIQTSDDEKNSKTALSIIILLDQIPRNLFRTKDTLPLVYTHYDPIGLSLIKHILKTTPRLDHHPSFHGAPPYRQFFYMPLMHSEDVEDHKLFDKEMEKLKGECSGEEGRESVERVLNFEKMHRDIVDRFGRYPHRNSALGRVSTEEEVRFMREGGASFGVADK